MIKEFDDHPIAVCRLQVKNNFRSRKSIKDVLQTVELNPARKCAAAHHPGAYFNCVAIGCAHDHSDRAQRSVFVLVRYGKHKGGRIARSSSPFKLTKALAIEVELIGFVDQLKRSRVSFPRQTENEGTLGGAEERILEKSNEPRFIELAHCLRDVRHPYGPRHHPLWRLRPERWLESLVFGDVSVVDGRLESVARYSQVPAFSASDRAMIDVLTTTQAGRLAVVELKADEDIHLPLQGLDYWSRVEWHHSRGEFPRFGYFEGRELSAEKPLLFLVAPALHIHPATDKLLRYLAPEIEWEFVGIDERWREGARVVFRKRPEKNASHPTPGIEAAQKIGA